MRPLTQARVLVPEMSGKSLLRAAAQSAEGWTLALTILLCGAFLLPGLTGHDPWKQDETYIVGVMYRFLQTGDWVVPSLAGQPFMEKPPLYYVTAALFARAFSPWLPLCDGARLANAFFMGLTLVFTGLAGHELWGRGYGRTSVLLLIGCIGLLQNAHEMFTDMGLLTGFALAYYGLALSRRRAILAGVLLGTGVGIGFMSKGLIAPGMLGIIALALPVVAPAWRRRDYLYCLLVALAAALPWLLIWPVMLYRRSHELFMTWFWLNNFGRYLGFAHLGADKGSPWFYARLLVWFAWPAWPFALWALWNDGREGLRDPSTQMTLVSIVAGLVVLNLGAVGRDIYALPLLPPLALLGAKAANRLPKLVNSAFSGFSIVVFGTLAVVLWYSWLALMTKMVPTPGPVARNTPAGFAPHLQWYDLAIAISFTVIWPFALRSVRESSLRAITSWTLGMTLVWGIVGLLWLPWLNDTLSYRPMITSLERALPARHNCIAGRNVGESMLGMLDYFGGIAVLPLGSRAITRCDLMLVQSTGRTSDDSPGPSWKLIWDGSRPDDTSEFNRLYRRLSLR